MSPVRPARLPWWMSLILIVLSTGCLYGAYRWQKSRCEARGGHIEQVYGGRDARWFCDGAER